MSFAHAPVSKGCLLGLCTTSFLAGTFSRKYLFNVPLTPHLTRDHQVWRFLTHHLAFGQSTELLLGVLLVFQLSVRIERSFGSVKYASFLIVSALIATALELLCLLAFYRLGFKAIPAGPFALVFSLLYQYHRIVPSSYQFTVGAISFNNKAFIYFLAAQLLMSQPFTTVIPCLCGLLAGALYRADAIGLRNYRIPKSVVRLASRIVGTAAARAPRRGIHASIVDVPPPAGFSSAFQAAVPQPAPGQTTGAAGGTATRRPNATAGRPALAEWAEAFRGPAATTAPSAESIASLQAMFPTANAAAIRGALEASGNDVSRAVERLLTTQ